MSHIGIGGVTHNGIGGVTHTTSIDIRYSSNTHALPAFSLHSGKLNELTILGYAVLSVTNY
ncbi:MAG: hypothetical protein KBT29_04675 [Prevotellaceae bacterium]|nr:hypothetical protein [Candidatus Minthosoma caballi]